MVSAPLILGQAQRDALRALREKAAASPFDARKIMDLCRTADGHRQHLESMKLFSVPIPVDFMVTFSIETGHPAGVCRHMSMSSMRRHKVPTPEAVWMVCEELGFTGSFEHCRVWEEDIGQGDIAINVIQPILVFDTEGKG